MCRSSAAPSSLSLPHQLPSAARKALRLLGNLQFGTLHIQLPDSSQLQLGNGQQPHATMQLRNWNVFEAVLRSGDIGFAETYIADDWRTSDLAALLQLFIRNRNHLESLVYGSWWGSLAYRLHHLLQRNTRAGSQRNIRAHYDLGNDFYALWLDPSMLYSSAWFKGDLTGDLTAAQCAKVRRALQQANVQAGDRVLEIGCGWGALAEIAAQEFQAKVTGLTLSVEQLAWAEARLHRNNIAPRPALRLQDYRDVQDESFDAICSIEMVEAVGEAYWPEYFNTIARLLKRGGRACLQSIVIDDALFERYRAGTDFIQQYIFPGGCLPSPSRFRAAAQQAGLRVAEEFAFGADYAETLRRWHHSFAQQHTAVMALGFDEAFIRTWTFYLAYCEAAFDSRNIDVVQYTLVKDGD